MVVLDDAPDGCPESLDTDLVAEIRLYVDCLRSQWALQETPETPQRPKAA